MKNVQTVKHLCLFFFLISCTTFLISAEVAVMRPIATSEFGLCTKIRGVVSFTHYEQVKPAPKGLKDAVYDVPFLNFPDGQGDKTKVVSIILSGFTKTLDEQIHDLKLKGKTVELIGYEKVDMRGVPKDVDLFPEISGIIPSDTDWSEQHTFVVMKIIEIIE